MKLIDRYVATEVLVTSLFAIAVLSVVLVLGNIFQRLLDLLVNHNVPLDFVLAFIAYIIPFSLTFTIPWGFLTAVLLVFGKMSADNELIALRCNGVSIPRICVPVLALAVIACGICFWINIDVAPRAQKEMKTSITRIATNDPIALFNSDNVISDFPGKKIYVEKRNGAHLENIAVYDINEKGIPMQVVYAREGRLETKLDSAKEMTIYLHLSKAHYEKRDDSDPENFSKVRDGIIMESGAYRINLEDLIERNRNRGGFSQSTLSELLLDKRGLAERSALRTEVSKRFSFSLASFAFALIAVPLAVTAHRKETSIGFLFSLIVAFVYFFFIIIANSVRDSPNWYPEYLMWLPNVLFITLGAILFWRLSRK